LILIAFLAAIGYWSQFQNDGSIDSIAVLPMENLSNNPDEEYFVDGMTEAIIHELSKIGALRVISRTSVMQYKQTQKSLPAIADELNVNSVLEGSVLRSGDQVRITAKLIGLSPERNLWANSYDRDPSDILALSSEVARAIAKEINVTLTPSEEKRIAHKQPVNPEAHELYLRGRHQLYKSTVANYILKSIDYFHESIAIDSNYAPAYAGIAEAYIQYSLAGYIPRLEAFSKAKAAALKALEIDSNNGEAYSYLAVTISFGDSDWEVAEDYHLRAVELSPASASTHLNYGYFLTTLGRHDEAIQQGEIAQSLDPLSTWINVTVGRFYFYARRYDEAIAEYKKVLDLNPGRIYPKWALAIALEQKGLYDESIATFLDRGVKSAGTNWALGYTYGIAGREDEARTVLNFLEAKTGFVPPTIIAFIYLGLGEKDNALEILQKSIEERESWTEFFKVHPWLDSIRDDPRFQDMMKAMKFPE
jgi:TolB-like protein/Tfp pilus assembly protein PilF